MCQEINIIAQKITQIIILLVNRDDLKRAKILRLRKIFEWQLFEQNFFGYSYVLIK